MPSFKRKVGVSDASPVIKPQKESPHQDVFTLLDDTLTRSKNKQDRIAWLQSQQIGKSLEFQTPFGRRRLTHADSTVSGWGLRYIENYIIQEVLPFYGNTHTDDSYVGSKTTCMVQKACCYIKQCMRSGADDMLLFCGSDSSGAIKHLQQVMGIIAPSILRDRVMQMLTEQERWVVFTGPYEHHSNLLSWRNSTAEVVEIGFDQNGLIDLEDLRCQLMSPKYANRPMLGSFSACCNVTGIIANTRAIARLLHEHGAFACFDFADSGPHVEIDMRSGDIEGYDAVFISPHKFLGGSGIPGILLVNKSLYQLGSSAPSSCGGGTVAYVNGFDEKDTLYHEDIEEREDFGTPPIIQKIRAALAFWIKEYVGYDLIKLRENTFAEEGIKRLSRHPNIVVLGKIQAERLPIFSFLIYPNSNSHLDCSASNDIMMYEASLYEENSNKNKPLHGRFVTMLLCDLFGIQARWYCTCASPYEQHLLAVDKELPLCGRSATKQGYVGIRLEWTHISFPYYMREEEFMFIISSIEFVATHGHRFLSLYSIDWVTGNWTFRKLTFKHYLLEDIHDLMNNKKREKNDMHEKFQKYLESATKIAFSLPNSSASCSAPEDIDARLIFFRI